MRQCVVYSVSMFVRDCILIINRGAVNCRLRNDFKGRGLKMGVFVGGGGAGGLTWTLILRIFGMVSITFFFAPPPLAISCIFFARNF